MPTKALAPLLAIAAPLLALLRQPIRQQGQELETIRRLARGQGRQQPCLERDQVFGAADDARWALSLGAAETETAIGRYAAALAAAVLGEWDDARVHADFARTHETFPSEVADALAFVAAEDVVGYVRAVEDVLASFEDRDDYLEGIPVADTVLVLQALAARREMAAELSSPLLPG